MINGRAAWSNPKVLSTLLMVFLAGAFTGAVGMRLGLRDRIHSPATGWSEANKAELLDQCKRDLSLTPDQAREMRAILDDYATYYQTLQEQLADVRKDGKSRILALLNEEQKQKFEQMMTSRAKR